MKRFRKASKRRQETRYLLFGLLRERAGIFALPAATASDVAAELRSMTGAWVSAEAAGRALTELGCTRWRPAQGAWSPILPRPWFRCWREAEARAMGSRPLWAALMKLRAVHRRIDEVRPVSTQEPKPRKRKRKPKLTAVARMYLDASTIKAP